MSYRHPTQAQVSPRGGIVLAKGISISIHICMPEIDRVMGPEQMEGDGNTAKRSKMQPTN